MAEGLTGSLSQLPLVDLLKMLAAGGQTGRLELTSGLDQGDIYLVKGEIVHADCDLQVGDVAFAKLVSWPNGQFRFEPQTALAWPRPPAAKCRWSSARWTKYSRRHFQERTGR